MLGWLVGWFFMGLIFTGQKDCADAPVMLGDEPDGLASDLENRHQEPFPRLAIPVILGAVILAAASPVAADVTTEQQSIELVNAFQSRLFIFLRRTFKQT